jgi:HAD superfamily hydrolase (TIGR01509 family)
MDVRLSIHDLKNCATAMSLPRKAHAVVFDMDGLIFDNERLYRDAMIAVARDWGYDLPVGFYLTTLGLPSEEARTLFSERFGNGFDFDDFWTATLTRFYEIVPSRLPLKAGVVELLDVLDGLRLPRAIATSARHQEVRHHLCPHGLLDRFQAIVAHGDCARGKPYPDPFLKAAELLGVEPARCLALEDSYNGVRAASNAGMMTIMVPDLLPATDEMEKLCIFVARDLHRVCALIRLQHRGSSNDLDGLA